MGDDTSAAREADRRNYAALAALRLAREKRWVRVREVGWALIATWQVMSLVSEFVPITLESRAIRIVGKTLGLVGLALVAYGFERLVRLARQRAEVHLADAHASPEP